MNDNKRVVGFCGRRRCCHGGEVVNDGGIGSGGRMNEVGGGRYGKVRHALEAVQQEREN